MKVNQKRAKLRQSLWPGFSDEDLWLRTKETGFTTIPRSMPLIGRAIDQLSGKGFPLSQTYLTLWCYVFDEAFVEIKDPRMTSYESGFTGKRGETTWKQRMRRLQELGFIAIQPGPSNDMQYVLLLDPLQVIARHFEKQRNDVLFLALTRRQIEVGGRAPEIKVQKFREELVVIIEFDGDVPKPLDVISKDNFLVLKEDGPNAEVHSAKREADGSKSIYITRFKSEENRGAMSTLRSWQLDVN